MYRLFSCLKEICSKVGISLVQPVSSVAIHGVGASLNRAPSGPSDSDDWLWRPWFMDLMRL